MAIPDYEAEIEKAIASGDIDFLRLKIGKPPLHRELGPLEGLCACVGARDGEELCRCKMWDAEVRKRVLAAGLERGKIIRAFREPEQNAKAPWLGR